MSLREHLDTNDLKFLDHVVEGYGGLPSPSRDAYAIFNAIQTAFIAGYQSTGYPKIDEDLIPHLAACSWVILGYNRDAVIPLDGLEHDAILNRVFRAFTRTIGRAIADENSWVGMNDTAGGMAFGCLHLPDWFVELVRGRGY